MVNRTYNLYSADHAVILGLANTLRAIPQNVINQARRV